MPKMPVRSQKVFAAALAPAPANNIAQFGSLAAAAPAFSNNPDVIQALPAWINGLASALINAPGGLASPALEDFNGLLYVITYQLAYLKQQGLAEWDSNVLYYTGSWAADNLGNPYKSITDDNIGNLLTDTNNWVPLQNTLVQGAAVSKAWATFNGFTGAIKSSYNIASIVRTGSGSYLVSFIDPMPNANYAWTGSVGTPNGGVPQNGDNNYLVGGPPGKPVVKTVNQMTVYSWESRNQLVEDSSEITLMVFGN